MSDTRDVGPRVATPAFETEPLTRQEYINVLIHFYRGESHRAMLWRQRLDTTTNWAVLTTAGVLSFTFAERSHEPVILLLSTFIIFSFLIIEARRYRYFEVYRARVRMLEENFLIPILNRDLASPLEQWRRLVARDLDLPKFKTTLLAALGFRLRRNYLFIFFTLLGSWLVKLMMHPTYATSAREIYERMAVGLIPSWAVLSLQTLFLLSLFALVWHANRVRAGAPQDEVVGVERDPERWKL